MHCLCIQFLEHAKLGTKGSTTHLGCFHKWGGTPPHLWIVYFMENQKNPSIPMDDWGTPISSSQRYFHKKLHSYGKTIGTHQISYFFIFHQPDKWDNSWVSVIKIYRHRSLLTFREKWVPLRRLLECRPALDGSPTSVSAAEDGNDKKSGWFTNRNTVLQTGKLAIDIIKYYC